RTAAEADLRQLLSQAMETISSLAERRQHDPQDGWSEVTLDEDEGEEDNETIAPRPSAPAARPAPLLQDEPMPADPLRGEDGASVPASRSRRLADLPDVLTTADVARVLRLS